MARGRRRLIPLLLLSDAEREALSALAASNETAPARRAAIVLASADRYSNVAIAARFGVTAATVAHWRNRFVLEGVMGLYDRDRSGRPQRDISAIDTLISGVIAHEHPHAHRASVRYAARISQTSRATAGRSVYFRAVQPRVVRYRLVRSIGSHRVQVVHLLGVFLHWPESIFALAVVPIDADAGAANMHWADPLHTTLLQALRAQAQRPQAATEQRRQLPRTRGALRFVDQVERAAGGGKIFLVHCGGAVLRSAPMKHWMSRRPQVRWSGMLSQDDWLRLLNRCIRGSRMLANVPRTGVREIVRRVAALKQKREIFYWVMPARNETGRVVRPPGLV
jgi:hypothetical protein